VVGLGLYTRTDHFQRWLREQTLAALQTLVNGEVSLEGVSGSVWEEIRLHGLSIRQNGVEVLSLPQGTVAVHLLAQLRSLIRSSSVQIAQVTLTEPVVRLVQEPEAGSNITHLLKPAEEPSTLSIFLSHVSIQNGQVEIRPTEGNEAKVTDLSLDGNLALLPSGMRAEVTSLAFTLATAGVPEVHWDSSLAYEDSGGLDRLSVQRLDLRTTLSHVQLSGSVDNLTAPILALTTTVEKLATADIAAFLPTPRLQQDIAGTVQVTGPLSALQVDASLAAQDGRVTTAIAADLSQTPPDAKGTLHVEHFVVDKVLYLPDVAGEVSGQVAFQGTNLETMLSEFNVYGSRLLVSGRPIGDLSLTGNLTKGQVAFTAETKGKAGYVYAQSQVTLGELLAYEMTLTARNLDTAQVTGDKMPPAANVNFDAWIKGTGTTLETVDGAVKLTLLPSKLGTVTLTQGQIAGTLRKGQLTLDKGILLANDTTVNVQGQLGGLQGTPHSKLSYSVLTKNIAPWLALAGIAGEGAINLSGTASGALTALSVEGKVTLADFGVGTNTLQNGTVTYTLTGVGGPQPRGRVSAALQGVQAGLRLRSVSADLALAGLQPVEVQAEITAQGEEVRALRLKTQTHYDPERLEVLVQELALQLPTGMWQTPQQPHLVLRDGALSIENFSLQRAEQIVSVTGMLAQQGPLDLQVQVNRFSLEELRPLLRDGPEVSGRVTAEVRVQGTAASPDVTANITTGTLTVAGQSYAGLTAQGTYRSERLDLNLLLRQDATHTLSVEGELPLTLGGAGGSSSPVLGEANLRVRSEGLSLAFLGLLSKDVQDVQGTVSMDVNLRGPVHNLIPSGSVQVRQGQARVKPLGQTFKDIAVELQLAQDTVRLTQFAVRAGDGQFTGSGIVALQHYAITSIDLTFAANRFRLIDTRQYRAAVSGRLTCSGSLQEPVVKGAMELTDTTVRPDLTLMKSGPAAPDATIVVVQTAQELTTPTQPTEPAAGEGASEPSASASRNEVYHRLALDLTVSISRDTWVHMEEGSIELMGQLHARKEPGEEPALSGAVETVRGWIAVHGRKFRLEKGNIVFTGATPIDPSLDVVARYTLPQYQVDVVVGGTAKAPLVSFRSEPPLEQTDILSLLVFGKPANALSKGEKVSLQSQAVQALAGSVAEDLRRSLAESLGVDNLELDVGETTEQSRIGVGKYIAPGVFVSTSQQVGGKQGRDVSIEYQLGENWQLKSSTTSQGNNGIDLLWKKRY
jgi:translocation and assembly module TamB